MTKKPSITKKAHLLLSIAIASLAGALYIRPDTALAVPCGTDPACLESSRSCEDQGGTFNPDTRTCSSGASAPADDGDKPTGGGLLSGVNTEQGKVEEYLQLGVDFLTAVTTLAIVVSVIIAGIQYSTAGGNPQAVAKAKEKIYGAVIALIASLLLYSFLQWLIPGGAFS